MPGNYIWLNICSKPIGSPLVYSTCCSVGCLFEQSDTDLRVFRVFFSWLYSDLKDNFFNLRLNRYLAFDYAAKARNMLKSSSQRCEIKGSWPFTSFCYEQSYVLKMLLGPLLLLNIKRKRIESDHGHVSLVSPFTAPWSKFEGRNSQLPSVSLWKRIVQLERWKSPCVNKAS